VQVYQVLETVPVHFWPQPDLLRISGNLVPLS